MTEFKTDFALLLDFVAIPLTRVWGLSQCSGRAAFGHIVEVVVADARQEKTWGLAWSSSHERRDGRWEGP
jgi:hypothetical protein